MRTKRPLKEKIRLYSHYNVRINAIIYLFVIILGIIVALSNPDHFTMQTGSMGEQELFFQEYDSVEEVNRKISFYQRYWAFNTIFLFLTLFFDEKVRNKFDRLGEKIMEKIK